MHHRYSWLIFAAALLLAPTIHAAQDKPALAPATFAPGTPAAAGFRVSATLKVGRAPHGIRFSSDGKRAYVSIAGAGQIAVVDLDKLQVVERIPAGKVPLDLIALGTPGQWAVTQFLGTEILRIDGSKTPLERWPIGKGPSLFTPETVDGKSYVTCEFADELVVFDAEKGGILKRHPTCKQPYPADVTQDGVLAFVPCRGDGRVAAIDLLNEATLAMPDVGVKLEGGALTGDGVSYLAASGGSDEVVYVNTAAFEVVARVHEGIGPRPFSVATTPDGRYALINNSGGDTLSILDVGEKRVVGRLKVGRQPIVVRMHPDGQRAVVANEIDGTINVVTLPPPPARVAPEPERPNLVAVVGTIHGEHKKSTRYSLDVLRKLIRTLKPDYVLAEIPPNRFDKAQAQFDAGETISEPRVKVFPEYVDVMFPLAKELGFTLVPTAGWNLPMHNYRNAALKRLAADPTRAEAWKAYEEAEKRSQAALKAGGAEDDPRYIHSDAYDSALEIELKAYATFDKDLGTGGWETINTAHYANIARALDAHRGEGKRFVITYGAGHKGWFLRQLHQRKDIQFIDVRELLK